MATRIGSQLISVYLEIDFEKNTRLRGNLAKTVESAIGKLCGSLGWEHFHTSFTKCRKAVTFDVAATVNNAETLTTMVKAITEDAAGKRLWDQHTCFATSFGANTPANRKYYAECLGR